MLLLACWGMNGQVTLYTEDFASQTGKGIDGTTANMTGITKWSYDVTNTGGMVAGEFFKVTTVSGSDERFTAFNTDAPSAASAAYWYSQSISTIGYANITASVVLSRNSSNSGSGVRADYSLDNGTTWVSFGSLINATAANGTAGSVSPTGTQTATTATVTGLAGAGSIRIRIAHWGTSSTPTYYHDNVLVQGTVSCTVPGVPTGLTATQNVTNPSTQLDLSWTANGSTTDYIVEVDNDSGFGSIDFTTTTAATSVTTTTLTEKTTYYVRVRARNTASCVSANTTSVSQATACSTPGAPSSSAASSITATGFTANWTGASGTVTGYLLDVSTASDFSSFVSGFNGLSVGNVLTYAVTGLSSSTPYYYRVRAINTVSCTGTNSGSQNPTTLAACTTPGIPGSVTATGQTTTGLTVNWTAGSGTVTGYQVDVATDSGFASIVYTNAAIASGATSQAATGLSANTTYYIRVRTLNGGCSSAFTATVTTTTACQAPAAQATSLSFNTVATTSLNGSFTASVSATGYLVLRSTSATAPSPAPADGTTYTAGDTVGGATVVQAGTGTTFSDSGLTNNTTYYYYVYAYNTGCITTIDYLQASPLTGSQLTTNTKTWYVNDSVFPLESGSITTAVGNNANSGLTAALPKADLQSAITAASAGDTILVDTGTWSSTATQTINKALTIIGNGPTNTVFQSSSVSGTIRWGTISASNVTIKDVQISKYDRAQDGIALDITSGTNILIDRCIIYNNVGSAGQGAVCISGAATSVTVRNTSLPCNRTASANYGGAMNIKNATVLIENCSMNNNVISALNGGALIIQGSSANVTITKTTFDANGASQGGAIAIADGTVNISNSCFDTNSAQADAGGTGGGGAILITPTNNSSITITDCTFTNNTANVGSSDGGAICFSNFSSPTVTSVISTCSFTNNTSRNGEDVNFNRQNSPTFNITFKNNTFYTYHSTGSVNLYNTDLPANNIKFEGLSTPAGSGGNGDIVANGLGVAVTNPEMTGVFTETSSAVPTSLPSTTCNDRFDGTCAAVDATFTCLTENVWNGTTWSRGHIPTIYEHVILNANYNTTTHGNIDACVLTVRPGRILTVDQSNNADNTKKTTYVNVINSINNSGTINVSTNGNLIQVNHPLDLDGIAIVTPNINVTKTTGVKYRWDYVYWSKPVSSSVMTNFNTAFDLKYYWDPSFSIDYNRNYLGWRTLSGEPTVGTGFITRVKTAGSNATTPTATTLTMSGTSNNGAITAAIQYYTADHLAFRNFTLLGNPYPGAISFQQFYNDNIDKIYGTCYLWSSKTKYPGSGEYVQADYASFNATGGVGVVTGSPTTTTGVVVPNGYIASGQGFMVRPKVNGTVTFNNGQRTKVIPSNDQFFRPGTEDEKDRYWLRITDAGKRFNEQLIGYVAGSTPEFDEAYDGPINSLSPIKFYTFVDKEKLIIQGRGAYNVTDRVALGYSKTTTTPEKFTISVSNAEGIFGSQQPIFLHDKELNVYTNISKRPYEFTGSANTENRFEVVYEVPKPVVKDDKATVTNTIVALGANILSIQAPDTIAQVTLYDISGKVVFEKTTTRFMTTFEAPVSLSTGVYIAKVKLTNNQTVTQKIINK